MKSRKKRNHTISQVTREMATPSGAQIEPTPERKQHNVLIPLPSGAVIAVSETEADAHAQHRVMRAIHRYTRSWEVGLQQQRSGEPGEGGGGGYASGGISEARLMAAIDFQDAGRAIGDAAHSLLTLALCQAVSVSALASRWGRAEKTIKKRIGESLELLVTHYRAMQKRELTKT